MKKYVILLCLAVLLTGCIAQPNDLDSGNIVDSTNDNISKKTPKGFSEEFYLTSPRILPPL